MEKLTYMERDYAARLEKYIDDENYSMCLYAALARRCGGNMAATLRAMSEDESRHLRAMQMEYYLLTGDSRHCPKADTEGDMSELMRSAYAGEWSAAVGYEREAEMQMDGALREVFRAQSADELRHRANVKKMLGGMLGM